LITVDAFLPVWTFLLGTLAATNRPLTLFLRASTLYHFAPIGKQLK
jgi:hypothetical protein